MYFVVNKRPYFSVPGPGPLLFFAFTVSNYAYKMTKCTQAVQKVCRQHELLGIETMTTLIKIIVLSILIFY